MNAPLYTIEILRLAASLRPPEELERVDGSAERRSPTCGSTIAAQVTVDGDEITALSQSVHACAFGQASAALLERHAVGRTPAEIRAAAAQLEAWLAGAREDAGSWPGLADLAPARSRKSRHAAILLPFRALLAALDQRS